MFCQRPINVCGGRTQGLRKNREFPCCELFFNRPSAVVQSAESSATGPRPQVVNCSGTYGYKLFYYYYYFVRVGREPLGRIFFFFLGVNTGIYCAVHKYICNGRGAFSRAFKTFVWIFFFAVSEFRTMPPRRVSFPILRTVRETVVRRAAYSVHYSD